jgi:hypothetical protein
MNSSTSGWLVLTRNFVAGSHPQNDSFGQAFTDKDQLRDVTINAAGQSVPLKLVFKPYQSLLVRIPQHAPPEFIDIAYQPPPAVPF